MTPPRVVVAPLALLALLPLGCSLLLAPETSVTIRPVPAIWGDGTTIDAAQDASYRADVRDYTYAYVDTEGDVPDFAGGLGRIAERHGVADWDVAAATYLAIGAGLAQAQVSTTTLDDLKRTFGGADPAKMAQIQSGFDRGR